MSKSVERPMTDREALAILAELIDCLMRHAPFSDLKTLIIRTDLRYSAAYERAKRVKDERR